jgi:Zn-dependent M16 (insulinase) family peptidase
LINFFFLSSPSPNRIEETEADEKERLEKWQKYLENEDARKEIEEKNQQSEATDDTAKPKIDSS